MKKLMIMLIATVAFVGIARAEEFPIQVTIPAATSVKFIVSDVKGSPPVFTAHVGNFLNFDQNNGGMKFVAGPNVWLGQGFFAIDLSPANGNDPAPGNYQSVTFSYGGQIVPAGQAPAEGLNKRATLTAVRVNSNQTESVLRNGALGAATAALGNADITGGFLRVYVGTATGEVVNGIPTVPGTVPFTNADKAGVYQGTLTISATLT